jgi:hypothetical protein
LALAELAIPLVSRHHPQFPPPSHVAIGHSAGKVQINMIENKRSFVVGLILSMEIICYSCYSNSQKSARITQFFKIYF